MADRIPIGTHPGLVSALVSVDLLVGTFAVPQVVSGLFLRRDPNAGAGAVVQLRTAPGGGGSGISATFASGAETASATGVLTATSFYLRVVSADPSSENLSGWFEIPFPNVLGLVGPRLTSVDRVKQQLEALTADTARDQLLDVIISGVSERIQRKIGRTIVESSINDEIHGGNGKRDLVLLRRPILTIGAVRIEGVAVASSTYAIDAYAGILHRVSPSSPYDPDEWPEGFRNVSIDYSAGYATIPEDLAAAATVQAAYDYGFRGQKIRDRGQVLDAGGSAQFLTGPWAPGVLERLASWREVKIG